MYDLINMRDIYNHTYYIKNKEVIKEKRNTYIELRRILKFIEHLKKLILNVLRKKKQAKKEEDDFSNLSMILDLN